MRFMKTTFLLPLILILLVTGLNLNAQDKNGTAPTSVLRDPNALHNTSKSNGYNTVEGYNSRFFGCLLGTGIVKSTLDNPGNLTNVALTTRNLFGGAIAPTGIYYALEYLAAGSGNLVTVDTTTGVITTIGPLTGLAAGHTVTGMAFDKTQSLMYGLSTNGTVGTLYTVNLSTGALTTVAGTTAGSALPIDIAINSAGIMYSADIGTDVLNIINKTTGAATTVGPLGINLNFAQGMCIDPGTDSLFLAAYIGTGNSGIYRCNTSTGAATLVGNFVGGSGEVDAFVIPGSSARPLNAFNLQTPPAGTRIVTVAGSSTPVSITWDTSASGASYKFVFGTPTLPTRRLTIGSTTNFITTTLGALDAILASNGFSNNGTATDSAVGQWDVWAYKGSGATGPDSLKSTNGPRALTFRRQQVALTPFALTAPASGITIITSPVNSSPVSFTWNATGAGATYRWLFKNAAVYSDPAYLRVLADNGGLTNSLNIRNSQLDSMLQALGVAPGDSIVGVWRVRGFSSSDSLNSTAPDRALTLRRTGLLPLDQHFDDPAMPPPFWSLNQGTAATQYWTRAAFSSYGNSAPGCAFYNFWSASATTGPQTLTSNTFPPVLLGGNNLRFNEACAYYNATSIDSCVIETSTDGGASWTRLIGMYQSLTLSSGYNNTPVMTTVAATAQFLAPTAGQWATKIYSMPVGTNKIRFIAKSAFGNNLYIDDITSGPATGVGTPITLTPNKYELSQNYPNPFNPTTKINFSLPKQGLVTLKIYDMLGKEISTLVNEIRTAGVYSVDFNAANLSSGAYFYQISAGEFTDVKRMMLIK